MSEQPAPIRLLIVDDHPIVRDGLRGAFTGDPEFEVVGEAGNGAEALDLVTELEPDLVLMDLRMPVMDGVTAIRRLSETAPDVRVLVLTTFDTDNDVLPAIEAGATSYLLKDAPTEELLRSARAAARGEAVLSPAVTRRLMDRVRRPSNGVLSARELEVLRPIANGSSNKEVASQLFITEASVKTHLLRIYDKLGVRDRAGAVGEAFRRGLVT
ncbi:MULTISPECIES: response regulator [unclassified Streptomyces]|uniref:response regulator n=1 Tax=unclassified Streptomyces TaxID=2593676 RepID=UPI0036A06146